MSARRIFTRPARIAAIAPSLWMALFFLVPFGFVLKISLSQTAIAQPPYLPVFDLTQGAAAIKAAAAALSLDNFKLLVSDDLYVLSYLRSLVVARQYNHDEICFRRDYHESHVAESLSQKLDAAGVQFQGTMQKLLVGQRRNSSGLRQRAGLKR